MKKGLKKILLLSTATLSSMYAYNEFVARTFDKKHALSDENGTYFEWKHGNIYYSKRGTGTPLLLIHDLSPDCSGFEYCKILKKLEKNHTVYTLDLLGCGRSSKPNMTYTNYLYVQLVTSFIKEVIKEQTDVVATGLSSSFVIMANRMDATLFHKIILINPTSIQEVEQMPERRTKRLKQFIELPLLGTYFYNRRWTPAKIDLRFRLRYYDRSQLISSKIEDVYYEAAHQDRSKGKYLYASILGNYMNTNIEHALKYKAENIYLIISRKTNNTLKHIENYQKFNNNMEVITLSGCNHLPQLEVPDKVFSSIEEIILHS